MVEQDSYHDTTLEVAMNKLSDVIGCALYLGYIAAIVAFWIAVIYVASHFIVKYR